MIYRSGQPLTDDHVSIARRVQQVSRSARFVPVLVLSEPFTRALTGFGNRRARRRRCFARLNFSLYLSAVNVAPLVPLLVSNTTRVIQDFLEPRPTDLPSSARSSRRRASRPSSGVQPRGGCLRAASALAGATASALDRAVSNTNKTMAASDKQRPVEVL